MALALPKLLGSLLHLGYTLRHSLSQALSTVPSLTSLHGPSVQGLQSPQRLHPRQWSLLASHSAEPQLLSMTPACSQNQSHLADSYTKLGCQRKVQPQLPLKHRTL